MCECVNALVGLIVMVEGVELWNRKGTLRDRRGTVEGPSRDRRRVVGLQGENQEVAVVYGRFV